MNTDRADGIVYPENPLTEEDTPDHEYPAAGPMMVAPTGLTRRKEAVIATRPASIRLQAIVGRATKDEPHVSMAAKNLTPRRASCKRRRWRSCRQSGPRCFRR